MAKVSKESVNYREATGDKHCGNCDMFNAPNRCDLVTGTIQSSDVCDRWTKRESNSTPSRSYGRWSN